ncbi:hypothetical protein Tco_0951601 [Tanacetum coccineum]|uniref:Uncharacterized protein n=1 Tax=Tanacetum coccineum TaxID=301880 RepID=A0ABQ5DXE6_9ASTR
MFKKTFEQRSSSLVLHQMMSDHNSSDLAPQRQEMSVENVSSGLVPQGQKASDYDNSDPVPPRQNVVPTAQKTILTTSNRRTFKEANGCIRHGFEAMQDELHRRSVDFEDSFARSCSLEAVRFTCSAEGFIIRSSRKKSTSKKALYGLKQASKSLTLSNRMQLILAKAPSGGYIPVDKDY